MSGEERGKLKVGRFGLVWLAIALVAAAVTFCRQGPRGGPSERAPDAARIAATPPSPGPAGTPPSPTPSPPTLATVKARLDTLGLPLEYVWPRGTPAAFEIFLSGDGGWASFDHGVANTLADRGVAVVAISSLRYFWHARTRAQVSGALRGILSAVGRPVFLGGYSFGAEVVPVVLNDWPPPERAGIAGLTLISPGPSATFEIKPLDWVRTPPVNPAALVAPALRALDVPTLCIAGVREKGTACGALPDRAPFHVLLLPGSHHLDGDYKAVGNAMAKFMGVRRN